MFESGNTQVFDVDFQPFGFDVELKLFGEKVDESVCEGRPLIILIDENHGYSTGIAESLRNACTLIDNGIVATVGVEGYPDGVKRRTSNLLSSVGLNLDQYLSELRDLQLADEEIIKKMMGERLLFAETLFLLRSDVLVESVEDPKLYYAAEKAYNEIKSQLPQRIARASIDLMMKELETANAGREFATLSKQKLLEKSAALAKEVQQELQVELLRDVQGQRDRAIVQNIFRLRESSKSEYGSLFNAGTRHQDAIITQLREQNLASVIRIRPSNFPKSELDL